MEKKKFTHKKLEPCKICGLKVDTSIEKYVVLIDYKGEEQYGIGFYHLQCLKHKMKGGDVSTQLEGIKRWGESIISKVAGTEIQGDKVVNLN